MKSGMDSQTRWRVQTLTEMCEVIMIFIDKLCQS